MSLQSWSRWLLPALAQLRDANDSDTAHRYSALKRSIITLMALMTVVPLCLMGVINYSLYKSAMEKELVTPLKVLVTKTKNSFELFLRERRAGVSFISKAFTFEELADHDTLNRIFNVAKQEFSGLVDLGLISPDGVQINYVGPYNLEGKDYSDHPWYQETRVRGSYISEVFMGYRNLPHMVIAVEGRTMWGDNWVLRATIDTAKFDDILASLHLGELGKDTEVYLLNPNGIVQASKGGSATIMTPCPIEVPPTTYQAEVQMVTGSNGADAMAASIRMNHPDLVLMVVRPTRGLFQAWYTLKGEMLILFIAVVGGLFFLLAKLTNSMVLQVRVADEKREAAYKEMEHTHKLSSIGRLAAGVAHEINNPLAIVNEKAGLLSDLLTHDTACANKEKYQGLVSRILASVDRCRTITHRLLGFARRMEVKTEMLDVNDVVTETLGFLEKEALYRKVEVRLELAQELPLIHSDRGRLQQVFLNILNNAFAAVDEGGEVSVVTWESDDETIAVAIRDTGCGMSEEDQKHIFEPFFTTKGGSGGTGLGMAITYGIVQKLGGRIDVWSKVEEGSSFTIFLPREQHANMGSEL